MTIDDVLNSLQTLADRPVPRFDARPNFVMLAPRTARFLRWEGCFDGVYTPLDAREPVTAAALRARVAAARAESDAGRPALP